MRTLKARLGGEIGYSDVNTHKAPAIEEQNPRLIQTLYADNKLDSVYQKLARIQLKVSIGVDTRFTNDKSGKVLTKQTQNDISLIKSDLLVALTPCNPAYPRGLTPCVQG